MESSRFRTGGRLLLGLWRQRRHSPVARIDDERRPPGRDNLCPPVPPDGVVADGQVGLGIAVAAVRIVALHPLLFIVSRFLLGEELLSCQLAWTLERRERGVGPNALQVRGSFK